MRHVEVLAKAPDVSCDEAYAKISDLSQYPKYSSAVRSVKILNTLDGRSTSLWEVNFREGILKWTEEDEFEPSTHTISFRQIEGDIEFFAGLWSVDRNGVGCLIKFACDFDLGIPGLNEFLEPIAEQALQENTRSIIRGLVPTVEFVVGSNAGIVAVP